jgi:peptidylprolyl isomerase/FKBP-type peptidyl-prolyl cis-trans isomerase FklB
VKQTGILAFAAALLAVSITSGVHAQIASPNTAQEQSFLSQNALESGVFSLPGLQYKILKSGPASGPHPRRSDDVTVRYEGRFIDGKVFNTSPDQGAGTAVFPLQKLIPGWIAALQLMRPGDVWRLYVPAYLAYGAFGKDYIPPNSTLIFKVELVAVTAPTAK